MKIGVGSFLVGNAIDLLGGPLQMAAAAVAVVHSRDKNGAICCILNKLNEGVVR